MTKLPLNENHDSRIVIIYFAHYLCRLQRIAPHHFEIQRHFVSKDVGTKITLCIQHLVESLRTSMFHFNRHTVPRIYGGNLM